MENNFYNSNVCWILVKPETLLYCAPELEEFLLKRNFLVDRKMPVLRLVDLSEQIYNDSKELTELYRALFKQLFGKLSDQGEVWYLRSKEFNSIEELYKILHTIKKEFRKLHWNFGAKLSVVHMGTKTMYGYAYFHSPDAVINEIDRESRLLRSHLESIENKELVDRNDKKKNNQ